MGAIEMHGERSWKKKTAGMTALIRHVRGRVTVVPKPDTAATVARYAAEFDAAANRVKRSDLNFFVFHAEVPSSHRAIEYVDVQHDHWDFDYVALSRHFLWSVLRFNKSARVYFVTDESTPALMNHPNVSMVRLPMDSRAPMYERVKAMAGYVHSNAFVANSIFLDTDAYPNRALERVFTESFDVGVTYRTTQGFMPINEGVIFCAARNLASVRAFFSAYLGTYDELRDDAAVRDYYGNDIDRWRGGQLALNAVALPDDFVRVREFTSCGARVRMLPCNEFNYWVTKEQASGSKTWDRKFVLHLKGDSKRFLDHVVRYQQARGVRDARAWPGVIPESDCAA